MCVYHFFFFFHLLPRKMQEKLKYKATWIELMTFWSGVNSFTCVHSCRWCVLTTLAKTLHLHSIEVTVLNRNEIQNSKLDYFYYYAKSIFGLNTWASPLHNTELDATIYAFMAVKVLTISGSFETVLCE